MVNGASETGDTREEETSDSRDSFQANLNCSRREYSLLFVGYQGIFDIFSEKPMTQFAM